MVGRKRKPLEPKGSCKVENVTKRSKKSATDSLFNMVVAKAGRENQIFDQQQGSYRGNSCKSHLLTEDDGIFAKLPVAAKKSSIPKETLWNRIFVLFSSSSDEQHYPAGFMASFFHESFDWEVFGLEPYEQSIFQEQYHLEQQFRVNYAGYVKYHCNFINNRRTALVDFMVTLNRKLELDSHCICKSVNLLDRYASFIRHLRTGEITATGTACIMIVMKYEFCVNFPLDDVCMLICPNNTAVFKALIIELESRILNAVDWQMHSPTSIIFLRRYYRIIPLQHNVQYRIAQCLCERVLLEPMITVQFLPSVIAATCGLMAASILPSEAQDTADLGEELPSFRCWNENMENYTEYTERDIRPCLTLIQDMLRKETHKRALLYVKKLQDIIIEANEAQFDLSWYERTWHWSQQEIADKEVLLTTMRAQTQCGDSQLQKLKLRQKYLSCLPAILESAARQRLVEMNSCRSHTTAQGIISPLPVPAAKKKAHEDPLKRLADVGLMMFEGEDSMLSGVTDMENSLLSTPSTKDSNVVDTYELYNMLDTMLRETSESEVTLDAVLVRYPDVYSYLVSYPPTDV